MELKDIASVSGKPGLYKVLKPTRGGLVLESLDEKKQKLVTGPQNRVSLLHEISVYTEQVDKTVPLGEIFIKIHAEFGADPGVDSKSESDELKAFLAHIIPDYDKDKVYVSDMRKMVNWYGIILNMAPELLKEPEKEAKAIVEEVKAEEKKTEEKVKKTAKPAAEKKSSKPSSSRKAI